MTPTSVESQANPGLLRCYPGSNLLRISGADALKWLQGIVTADLNSLAGHAFWGLMLQRNGKVRCEVAGLTQGTSVVLAVIGGELDDVYGYLDSMILMDDVELTRMPNHVFWAIQGGTGALLESSLETVPAAFHGSLRWFGEHDQVFVVDRAREPECLNAFQRLGFAPCTDGAWEQLRIRSGVPKWAVDFSTKDTPHHAALFGRAVALSKGCYIGQEVVCKAEMIGRVSSRLTRIELDSFDGVDAGADVQDLQTGESAGVITSAVSNGAVSGGWAIARVKSSVIEKQGGVSVGQARGRIVDMLRAVSP